MTENNNNDHPVLSASAIEALQTELEELKTTGRQKMSERLLEARELGDISENSEYESAKQDQAMLEGRIKKLEHLLRNAVVREDPKDTSVVAEGIVVTVRDSDDHDFTDSFVVGQSEERASGARVLSPESPLGRALLGKGVGDTVTYEAPGGTFTYEIVSLDTHEG